MTKITMEKNKTFKFDYIQKGTIFLFNETLYIKSDYVEYESNNGYVYFNSLSLNDGVHRYINYDTMVYPVVEIVVKF